MSDPAYRLFLVAVQHQSLAIGQVFLVASAGFGPRPFVVDAAPLAGALKIETH